MAEENGSWSVIIIKQWCDGPFLFILVKVCGKDKTPNIESFELKWLPTT